MSLCLRPMRSETHQADGCLQMAVCQALCLCGHTGFCQVDGVLPGRGQSNFVEISKSLLKV